MEHTKHIWRAAILISLLATAGLILRHALVPASFGEQGFYRYDSLAGWMTRPVIHGGSASCRKCHEEIHDTWSAGKHAPVSCEACHAPLAGHTLGEDKAGDMPVDTSADLCATCHTRLPARPDDMPQLDFAEHLEFEPGTPVKGPVCALCHDDSHSPFIEE